MAKPYSIDLRKRAVAAVVTGGLSRHRAAARFGVAVSTVIGWVRHFHEAGNVAPGQMGGHKPRKIIGEHEVWLANRIRASDFTLHGLVAELSGRGLKVDYHTVWDFVHAAQFSYKKRRWSPASETDRMSPAAGHSG
jgi:putative transposase